MGDECGDLDEEAAEDACKKIFKSDCETELKKADSVEAFEKMIDQIGDALKDTGRWPSEQVDACEACHKKQVAAETKKEKEDKKVDKKEGKKDDSKKEDKKDGEKEGKKEDKKDDKKEDKKEGKKDDGKKEDKKEDKKDGEKEGKKDDKKEDKKEGKREDTKDDKKETEAGEEAAPAQLLLQKGSPGSDEEKRKEVLVAKALGEEK